MSEAAMDMGPREPVRCDCGHHVFDGIVVRSRVVRVLPRGGAEAMCRCKRWHRVPLTYQALPDGVAQIDRPVITMPHLQFGKRLQAGGG